MSSGAWNHAVCDPCWQERQGLRVPVRVVEAERERCCYCRKPTTSGIYVREKPDHPSMKCEGNLAGADA